MKDLNPTTAQRIEDLASEINDYIDNERPQEAFGKLLEALDLIPDPKHEYAESTWLYATLGDIYFTAKDYEQGLSAFTDAVFSPEGIGNPFIHLRLGQCHFELGDLDKAAGELIRAYAIEGDEIFAADDPKYLAFLKTKAKL